MLNSLIEFASASIGRTDKEIHELLNRLGASTPHGSAQHDQLLETLRGRLKILDRTRLVFVTLVVVLVLTALGLVVDSTRRQGRLAEHREILDHLQTQTTPLRFSPSEAGRPGLPVVVDMTSAGATPGTDQEASTHLADFVGPLGRYYGLGRDTALDLTDYTPEANQLRWFVSPVGHADSVIGYIALSQSYGRMEQSQFRVDLSDPVEFTGLDRFFLKVVDYERADETDAASPVNWLIDFGEQASPTAEPLWTGDLRSVPQSEAAEYKTEPMFVTAKGWRGAYLVVVGLGKYGADDSGNSEGVWGASAEALRLTLNQ